jgi:hypothetical protein
VAEFTYANAQDCYTCPQGRGLTREARRHQLGNPLYRRSEARAADGTAWPLREQCVQTAATRRKHLAVWVESAKETLSQPMIAKLDTPEARKM